MSYYNYLSRNLIGSFVNIGVWFAFGRRGLAGKVLLVPLVAVLLALETEAPAKAQTPVPQIKLSAPQKHIGETVEVSGSGFAPGATIMVQVVSPGQEGQFTQNIVIVQADDQGLFSLPVLLQNYADGKPLQVGAASVVAGTQDGTQKASARLELLRALEPKLSASPVNGPVGTVINLKGSDFPPNTSLNIAIGRPNGQAGGSFGSPVTNASGTFEVRITLPAPAGQQVAAPGEIFLVAHTADFSIKAQTTFQVTGPTTGGQGGGMPGGVPSTGQGFEAGQGMEGLNSGLLVGLIFLAATSLVGLIKVRRKI